MPSRVGEPILIRTLSRLAAGVLPPQDRKSTRLNSSHANISYAVFCLKKKNKKHVNTHRCHLLTSPHLNNTLTPVIHSYSFHRDPDTLHPAILLPAHRTTHL